MKKILLITTISLLFFSCSNELDRGDAENMIKEFYEYPNVEFIQLQATASSEMFKTTFYDLASSRFITHRRKGKYGDVFYVRTTLKGRAFLHPDKPFNYGSNVASNLIDFKEITGIRFNPEKTVATVEYKTIRKETTPFGEMKKYKNGDDFSETVQFILYDDGWRIDAKKANSIKKEQVDGFNKTKLENLTNVMNKISIETSNSYFLLKEKYTKFGYDFLVVDYIGADGSNTNTKLRTFVIGKDFNKEDYCGGIPTGFFNGLNEDDATNDMKNSGKTYLIVDDGVIKCIALNTAG